MEKHLECILASISILSINRNGLITLFSEDFFIPTCKSCILFCSLQRCTVNLVNWAINSAKTSLALAEGLDNMSVLSFTRQPLFFSLPFLHSLLQKINEKCLSGKNQYAAHHKACRQRNKKPVNLQEKVCNSHMIVYYQDAQTSCFRTAHLWRGKSPIDESKLGKISISVSFLF